MSKYVNWIEYQGRPIMFVNYAGLHDEAEYLRAIKEFESETLKQPPGSRFRILTDVTDSILTSAILQGNKDAAARAKEAGIPDNPTALVGLAGFKLATAHAFSFFRPGLYFASSMQDAKDWLVKQKLDDK